MVSELASELVGQLVRKQHTTLLKLPPPPPPAVPEITGMNLTKEQHPGPSTVSTSTCRPCHPHGSDVSAADTAAGASAWGRLGRLGSER